jgi:hypothetical protein
MTDKGDLSQWTEAQLRAEAASWRGAIYDSGETGDCNPAKARWQFVADFPLSTLHHLVDDWAGWFAGEIEMDETEQLHRGYRAMQQEPIIEAIVVVVVDGKGYIWDGWHRAGAALSSGRTTLRAIVGTPAQTARAA